MRVPWKERKVNGGDQKLYKFDNGYGASVVKHYFSYGNEQNLWELAVIKFQGEDWSLTYETRVTDDVIGHLTLEEVEVILTDIESL